MILCLYIYMNNLDPLSRQKIIATLARLQPAAVVRLSATSRAMRNETANKKRQIDALKRLVRRRRAIKLHFETPTQPGGPRGRLRSPLHMDRLRARAMTFYTPRRLAARRTKMVGWRATLAYKNYNEHRTNAMWNRFVRIHAKRPGYNATITRQQARNMYRV